MANEDASLLFDDKINENETITEIPKEVRKINTQAYDKSVSDIIRMIDSKDITLNPEYQRNYVWDNKKASLLIESIILNVPIPVIYVSQEEDDSWTVIDGLQRLYSLKRFFDRDFKLSGLEILSELDKSDIKSLNSKALRILNNGLLRIIVISHDSNEEIKYDIFMRLNRGSVKLNEQELRNCLYRGSLNTMLKTCVEDKNWLSLLGLNTPHKRMIDRELVLRFLAINHNWDRDSLEINGYKGRMKSFLNEFMNINKNLPEDKIKELNLCFSETVDKVITIFGIDAFRRLNPDGTYENSLNRAIMDVVMLSVTLYSKSQLLKAKSQIQKKFSDLLTVDIEFRNSIIVGTSDRKVINYRINRWCTELNNIINGQFGCY